MPGAAYRRRDDKQALGELREAVDLPFSRVQGGQQLVGRSWVRERKVELQLEQGERRPQLVAGLGDEQAFALKAGTCGTRGFIDANGTVVAVMKPRNAPITRQPPQPRGPAARRPPAGQPPQPSQRRREQALRRDPPARLDDLRRDQTGHGLIVPHPPDPG